MAVFLSLALQHPSDWISMKTRTLALLKRWRIDDDLEHGLINIFLTMFAQRLRTVLSAFDYWQWTLDCEGLLLDLICH